MSRLLVVVAAVAAFVGAAKSTYIADNPPIWRQLITLFFSRGIYFVLAVLILGCFIITTIKNKIDNVGSQSETKLESSWAAQGVMLKSILLPSADIEPCRTAVLEDIYANTANTDILKEAEARNNALKKELDQLNRIRLTLEEKSGVLEREKAAIEDELEETKLKSALENESLRKETAMFQRQLQQLKEEKEVLSREMESAARESRMTDYALKDQILLAERLDNAKKEVAELQKGLEALRQERDTAVAIAADLAARCQGVAGESAHIITKYIQNRKIESNKLQESSDLKLEGSIISISNEEKEEDKENISRECSSTVQGDEQDAGQLKLERNGDNSGSIETECECAECSKQKIRLSDIEIMHQHQYLPCSELGLGPVTGSEAFRDFLITSFTEN